MSYAGTPQLAGAAPGVTMMNPIMQALLSQAAKPPQGQAQPPAPGSPFVMPQTPGFTDKVPWAPGQPGPLRFVGPNAPTPNSSAQGPNRFVDLMQLFINHMVQNGTPLLSANSNPQTMTSTPSG